MATITNPIFNALLEMFLIETYPSVKMRMKLYIDNNIRNWNIKRKRDAKNIELTTPLCFFSYAR